MDKTKLVAVACAAVAVVLLVLLVLSVNHVGPFDRSLGLDKSTVADDAVRTALSAYDSDGNGMLSTDEVDSVTALEIADATDLSPIRNLSNLESLVITGCACPNLDLSANKALKVFRCTESPSLTSLTVGEKPALETFVLQGSGVSQVSLASAPKVADIQLDDAVAVTELSSQVVEEAWVIDTYEISGDQSFASAEGATRKVVATQEFDEEGRGASTTVTQTNNGASGTRKMVYNRSVTYDLAGRISAYDYSSGNDASSYRYEYDADGRLAKSVQTDAANTSSYSYDDKGRLVSVQSDGGSLSLAYASDAPASVTTASDKGSYVCEGWTYGSGKLTAYTQLARHMSESGYVTQGTLSYDGSGRCTGVSGQLVSLDVATGAVSGTVGAYTVSYTYDAAGNAVSASSSTGSAATAVYDQSGNIIHLEMSLRQPSNDRTCSYTVDLSYKRVFVDKGCAAATLLSAPTLSYDYELFTEPAAVRTAASYAVYDGFGADFDGTLTWNKLGSAEKAANVVSVPDLKGLSPEDARTALESAGLVAVEGERVSSSSVAAGLVRKQDPAAGTEVAKGTSVTYQVSKGSESSDVSAKKSEYQTRLDALKSHQMASGTMSEMAEDAAALYADYKTLLDEVYATVASTLSGNDLAALQSEQDEWTASREAAIKAVSENYTGASGFALSLQCSSTGFEYTRDRVQDLLNRL